MRVHWASIANAQNPTRLEPRRRILCVCDCRLMHYYDQPDGGSFLCGKLGVVSRIGAYNVCIDLSRLFEVLKRLASRYSSHRMGQSFDLLERFTPAATSTSCTSASELESSILESEIRASSPRFFKPPDPSTSHQTLPPATRPSMKSQDPRIFCVFCCSLQKTLHTIPASFVEKNGTLLEFQME